MGRGWAAEAQRAVWRPLILAQITSHYACKTSLYNELRVKGVNYLPLKPFLMSLSIVESFRNVSLLASRNTLTFIVYTSRVANYI